MGISDFVQNIYKINTFPISFWTRGGNANRISDSDTPSSRAGRKEAITCLETSATGRMAGGRIGTSRTIQPEPEQQQPVQSPVPESAPNPPHDSVPISPPTEPIPESAPVEQTETSQQRPRMKQKAQRFPQKKQKEPTPKRRRTEQQTTQPSPIPESV